MKVEKSIVCSPRDANDTSRYVGSMFLSDTAMLRNGTKFVTDLPVREAGYQTDPRCAVPSVRDDV